MSSRIAQIVRWVRRMLPRGLGGTRLYTWRGNPADIAGIRDGDSLLISADMVGDELPVGLSLYWVGLDGSKLDTLSVGMPTLPWDITTDYELPAQ